MAERLRALLEHPLDPRVVRAVVTLASGASVGFGVLIAVGVSGPQRVAPAPQARPRSALRTRSEGVPTMAAGPTEAEVPARSAAPRQDPQDRSASAAHARAERELESHRALQHVPYREGSLRIELVGAQGRKGVLTVSAQTLAQAHRGYDEFLRRYRDDGRAYLPRFRVAGDRNG